MLIGYLQMPFCKLSEFPEPRRPFQFVAGADGDVAEDSNVNDDVPVPLVVLCWK